LGPVAGLGGNRDGTEDRQNAGERWQQAIGHGGNRLVVFRGPRRGVDLASVAGLLETEDKTPFLVAGFAGEVEAHERQEAARPACAAVEA
jgi:hypothetical protein